MSRALYPEDISNRRLTLLERAAVLNGAGLGLTMATDSATLGTANRAALPNTPPGAERLVRKVYAWGVAGSNILIVVVTRENDGSAYHARYPEMGMPTLDGQSFVHAALERLTLRAGDRLEAYDQSAQIGTVYIAMEYVDVLP